MTVALYDRKPPRRALRKKPLAAKRRVLYEAQYSDQGPTLLGFELELEAPRRVVSRSDYWGTEYSDPLEDGEQLWQPLQQELAVEIAEDGSLSNGYEVVMPPATLGSWRKLEPGITTILAAAKRARHKPRRTCGLHVHISRSAFSRRNPEVHVDRLVSFLATTRHHVTTLAGRRTYFASFTHINNWKAEARIWARRDWSLTDGDHYRAASFMHEDTVEFRIFRSTTDWKEILRAMEFTAAVVAYTKHNHGITWTAFKMWVRKNQALYPNLHQYLKKRKTPACVS